MSNRWLAAILGASLLIAAASAWAAPATQPAAAPAGPPATGPSSTFIRDSTPGGASLAWHATLQDAIDEAQRQKQPILVDVGAEWCSWCKLLDKEIVKPAVQAKLAKWTRVRLDADKDTDAVRTLAVGPIPALRVLSPLGRVVASHDGYLSGEDLTAWLDKNYTRAAVREEAIGDEPADAGAAAALADRLTDADPVVREAATRRLLRRPDLAAPKVAEVFSAGKLAARLAALELLQEWKAPVAGLDPWQPATITPQKLDGLKQWAEQAAKAPPPPPPLPPATAPSTKPSAEASLTGSALADARRDLALMLQATTDPEARAARERLARLGMSFMPEVYAALKSAATDRDRERLTALRYRLAASDGLALAWSGGFDRLASADPQERHRAVEELGGRVSAADAPLLLELFSDPDSLVREGSLRLLQAIGGQGTTAGLVRLLEDPEPNVRAAVLKQLAETPVPGMEPKVIEFVKKEKDTDLVVHAVRVLKESKTPAAVGALMDLLGHESWRVRAEAAEALAKRVENASYGQPTEQAADIYARMIKLLEDPDGFVVSRAVLVLRDAKVSAAVDPLAAAAEKRPELAPDVVRALGQAGTPGAVKHLRAFCASPNPTVRAAAISGLCTAAPQGAGDELHRALTDDVASVRLAGARAMVAVLEKLRPNPAEEVRGFLGMGKASKRDMEGWLGEFRGGRLRPEWLERAAGPLEKMLAGEVSNPSPEEPVAAAVPLVALGRDDKALPVLRAAAGQNSGGRNAAAQALPWLPAEARIALFKELAARADAGELAGLVRELGKLPSPAAAGPLWDVLGSDAASPQLADTVHDTLKRLYLGERYYDRNSYTPEMLKPMLDAANQKAADGSPMQRLVALATLLEVAPESAVPVAEKLIRSRPAGDPLRTDAFQVLLLAKPRDQAEHDAVQTLAGAPPGGGDSGTIGGGGGAEAGNVNVDWEMKKAAVRFLAQGPSGVHALRGSMWLNVPSADESISIGGGGGGQAIVVTAPKGLTPDVLRPLLADTDRANAAAAGYLLCVLGDRSGFDPLVRYWREVQQHDNDWRRLVYRAVAVLDDDGLVPVLEEVYASIGTERYYAREFYWTIRPMKGPRALKLRKKMRDEVGMEQLR